MSTSIQELAETVAELTVPGKGILAADESDGTIAKRFKEMEVVSTAETRRDYREMLFSTPGLSDFISGAILFEETLKQNFEHITVTLTFDGDTLGDDVVHPLTFTQSSGLVCLDFGVLLSNWKPGKYELKAVATFEETINDGMADYDAGDYVFVYNVTVTE